MKKQSLPFSNAVTEYFKTHPKEYLDIHCGSDAQRESEWDAMYPEYVRPSLYLPHLHDYKAYWWPVANLTIILNWNYEDVERQIRFANYLTHVCKANCIFTLLDGIDTKFMDTGKLAITNRVAA